MAASENALECAKLLVKHNADIKRRCNSGGLAIHYAASRGGLDVLRLILQIPGVSATELLCSVDDEEAT